MLRNAQIEKRRSMADTGNRRPVAVRASQSMVECFDTSLSITSSTERRNGPIRSKIGSMNNISHRPGGGQVKIESKRMSFAGVQSKIGSMDKVSHKPGGGQVKIESKRMSFAGVQSKIGS